MSEYQCEVKQIVDYPRCRIYRQFVQSLINDRSIRISGGSGLFCFPVLCRYANFRTSYRRIDGISYTVYPGEWIVTAKELSQWFRTRFHWQAIEILEKLQKMHLLSFISLNREKVIKYRITDWRKHNTVLDYNCPCQKDSGFFFMPLSPATELISTERCSEMDIILDLWLSTVYNDTQVQGSEVGPVVYLRNGTGSPIVSYSELSARWGISKAMATLAQLKRDADSGRMSVMLLWRFGKTGNDIPREMRGVRKVFRSNSVGLVLELNGKESTLYIASAKLVEYDGKTLNIYRPGYRPPTAEERFVLNTWKTTEDKYIQENPFGDCFGKRKAYFASSTCPWMDCINKIRGMRYCPEKDKVLDFSVRSEMILRYEVYLDP